MAPDVETGAPREQPAAPARNDRLVAIGLMVVALFCFACLDSIAKFLNQHMHPAQVVWCRYASAFFLMSLIINPWRHPGLFDTRRTTLQLSRGLLLLGSTALNFVALLYLQLDQTAAIVFSTPFWVALLAGPILGERLGPRRWAAIVVGFLGVLIVIRPGLGGLHWAATLSVLSAICYAVYNIATKVLSRHDSTETTLFYGNLIGFAVPMPLMPLLWTTPDSFGVILGMVAIGGFGTVGHYLLIMAHRLAPAGILAPFIYTQIVWMISFGWLFFGQLPDRWTLIGAAVVISSGIYLLHRERVRRLERGEAD
jgi:drug/metabolite transporter (DMT)-like permease